MNFSIEHVENKFANLLQKEVSIVHRGKVLRAGRIVLFSVKDFYLLFRFNSPILTRPTILEIPYPFACIDTPESVTLSYRVDKFINNDAELKHHMLFYFYNKPSKYFDTDIVIYKK